MNALKAVRRSRRAIESVRGWWVGRQRIAGDSCRNADYPRVELFHWKPGHGCNNVGDFLSKVVVERILATRERSLDDETPRRRRLLAVGSIIHCAATGDTIWGSGVNGKIDDAAHRFEELDVRAVRGPLTREFLLDRGISAPDVYGDPALLLPILFPTRFIGPKRMRYTIVPNLHDVPCVAASPHVLSPFESWNRFVSTIVQSELVVSSSLHGLIVAEAFGVPARYVRLSETESLFKFRDYYAGTGRKLPDYATSIDAALEMGGVEPPALDLAPLIEAFPWDLWPPDITASGSVGS